jgi:hypothetical protein
MIFAADALASGPSYSQTLADGERVWITPTVVSASKNAAIAVFRAEQSIDPKRKGMQKRKFADPLLTVVFHAAVGSRKLTLPAQTVWYGLGPQDAVFAADKKGQLWRAESIDNASAGNYQKLAVVAGATQWDIHPEVADFFVAAAGKAWWSSTDGGKTFARHKVPFKVEGAFVRQDRVIVLDPKGAPPMSSNDGGVTWNNAPTEVGDLHVRRDGNWIGEMAGDRESKICRNGVLGLANPMGLTHQPRRRPISHGLRDLVRAMTSSNPPHPGCLMCRKAFRKPGKRAGDSDLVLY